MKLRLKSL